MFVARVVPELQVRSNRPSRAALCPSRLNEAEWYVCVRVYACMCVCAGTQPRRIVSHCDTLMVTQNSSVSTLPLLLLPTLPPLLPPSHPSLPPWLPTAHARQVLELCLLQVYLCVWCDECSGHAGAAVLVRLVLSPRDAHALRTALQGPLPICEPPGG